MELIASCASNNSGAPPPVQRIIERLAETANVPRNKAKFGNFIKNSLKVYSDGLINDTWSYLEKVKGSQAPAAVAPVVSAATSDKPNPEVRESGSPVIEESSGRVETSEKKKKKKRKDHDNEGLTVEDPPAIDRAADVHVVDDVDGGQEKKKKKKKKRQASEVDEQIEDAPKETYTCASPEEVRDVNDSSSASEKTKKKKRRKESSGEDN
jgi:hypothetical protein